MQRKLRVGALISGGGTNLQAIIDRSEAGEIDADIVFVGSDTPDAKGLGRAEKHGIPHFTVDYVGIIRRFRTDPERFVPPPDFDLDAILSRQHIFPPGADTETVRRFLTTRAAAEAALLKAMSAYPFDLLVLAGFMRNLTPYFIDRVNTDPERPRIMNIHPAILPAFPGVDGYGDTFRHGCKVGGCTVHFIDYGEDSGPIIGQRTFPIDPGDTLEAVRAKGLREEWILYPACIQLFAENRLKVVRRTHALPDGRTMSRAVVEIDYSENT
ncbi:MULTISPECIES: phosphoribosylglycinamide formyltransferase [Desulfococcus]|jgi:phosphoribosylglycinamide formyltransferase-1|uniref:Phosphoribosylglycinamide formyltransferase n=1 Tax=Desulfococcus multivorans DSM 2059 TaxID=1121405 RepID=S7TZK6_DESML|nr:phosphoribosylglycinamide formyltransferase [Desulfococcus multivorans]AOY58308.1 PurN: phosphoribosylglycinamide formyltransferase [Desulfococcus multivorans]AQV00643.1 phosphoribosylglycinamide formyltransferase [Desulfococcus multivorans]EPR42616.1 phosphoribosylglycinamide formyltransferase [Desulfococcus multivorans DSM 2059]MDX9818710.1 phosphoribosylglycinamide formyltransferase [Desulfococcus multivorans]SKA17801.1 formyltetrahydrofolate-dependent phosphoribosylglycinamide formyltra